MRAITQRSFGGPEVLELTETESPGPLPTEVLVEVKAAALNPIDAIVRSGAFPLLGEPPFVLGWDVSGVVEEVGFGVTRFHPGDEVFGMPWLPRQAGAYAEYLTAPSRQFARKPASLDHVRAAALPLSALTAWQALVDTARVSAGQRVLIHAAAGGVGHLAVQIARALGAYVIGTASAPRHDLLRELGADELIDYTVTDFARAVRDADVVLDLVGGDYAARSVRTLRSGGVLVQFAANKGGAGTEDVAAVAAERGVRLADVAVEPDQVGLEQVARLVESGQLHVHIEHTLPLEEAAKAHEILESGHVQGKVVLTH